MCSTRVEGDRLADSANPTPAILSRSDRTTVRAIYFARVPAQRCTVKLAE